MVLKSITNQIFRMNRPFAITSVTSNVNLPKEKLENFINNDKKRDKISFDNAFLPNLENISLYSVYTPVSGDVKIGFANKRNGDLVTYNVPVETWFLVTCTKRKFGSYKLTFGVSLS